MVKAGLVSNKKTNAANKSDEKSCQWAFLSTVKQFQDRAKSQGASKVGNIVSYYKNILSKVQHNMNVMRAT